MPHFHIPKKIFLLLSFITVAACGPEESGGTDNPSLNQAMAAARYLISDRYISRSGYAGQPRSAPEFLNYLFSDFGVAEWPIAFDDFEAQQLRSAGIPVLPQGVSLSPNYPDPSASVQVVIRAVPAENKLVVEAYESAAGTPVQSFERIF